MKKLAYILMLTAAVSLMCSSCKKKDKDHSEDDMDSLTLVVDTVQAA